MLKDKDKDIADMSFNINRLVQPECGGPNPLVAAAQQITNRPRNPIGATNLRHINPNFAIQRQQPNFTKEFANQYTGKGILNQKILQHQQPSSLQTHPSTSQITLQQHQPIQPQPQQQQQQQQYEPALNYMLRDRLNISYQSHQQQQQPQLTAGEQLETKYRNDIISSTKATKLDNNNINQQGRRADDVEFWQSLSQKYIGPSTYDNISKLRSAGQTDRLQTNEQQQSISSLEGSSMTATASESRQQQQQPKQGEDFDETVRLGQADYDPSKWFEPVSSVQETEYIFDERNPLKDEFEDPFAEGLKRLEQGDIPSAALLFEAAVQREPENSLAWQYLGTTQAQNEKDISAIRALRQCLELDPSDQKARLAIAVSLANELQRHESYKHLLEWLIRHDRYKSLNASLDYFNQLSATTSSDVSTDTEQELMIGLGSSLDDKKYDYVRDKFVEAARMSPRDPDPEVQNSLGVLFNMRGEYDKAVDCFKAALSVRSDDSLLWNRLGATLANGNKSDEAIAAYRKALELAPGFLRTRYNLAISLIHLNLYDEAAKQLVQILNMQAAGKGSKNVQIRTRSITSTSIWNTLRTVSTLLNKPELYPIIDGRDLDKCNEQILKLNRSTTSN